MLSSSRPTCERRAEAGRSSRAMKSLRNSLTVNVISASAVLEPDCSVWRWAAVAMTRNARRCGTSAAPLDSYFRVINDTEMTSGVGR